MTQSTARLRLTAKDDSARAFRSVRSRLNKLDKVTSKLSTGLAALGGGAALAGLGALAKRSLDAADSIEKLSRRTGASAKFLSEMRFSLSQNDVSLKDFGNSLRKINKSAADAKDGLATQSRAFKKLEIDVDSFLKLNTDQKFSLLSEAIARVEDPAKRTQIAMDIMGRSGSQLLTVMEGGAAGLEKYRMESVKMGKSLSDDQVKAAAAANDAMDKLATTIGGGLDQVIVSLSPKITNFINRLLEMGPVLLATKDAIIVLVGTFAAIKLGTIAFNALSASVIFLSNAFTGMSIKSGIANASMLVMTKSTAVLRSAMFLLGGPAGVIALAVTGFYFLAKRMNETSTSARKLEKDILKLKDADNLFTKDELTKSLNRTTDAIEEKTKKVNRLTKAVNSTVINGKVYRQELDNAKKSLGALIEKKTVLEKRIEDVTKSTKKATDKSEEFDNQLKQLIRSISVSENETNKLTKSKKGLTDALISVIKKSKEITNIFGDYASAAEEVDAIILKNQESSYRLLKIKEDLDKRLKSGKIKLEEYKEALKSAGIETESLGKKSETTADLMQQSWRKFQDGVQDAFYQAFRHGDNFFKSLKKLAFDILAQIAAKMATTFAMNKFKKWLNIGGGGQSGGSSGGGLGGFFNTLKGLFGKGGASSGAGGGGAGSGTGGILNVLKRIFGGGKAEGGIFKSISSLFSKDGGIAKFGAKFLGGAKSLLAASGPLLAAVAGIKLIFEAKKRYGTKGLIAGILTGGLGAKILGKIGILSRTRKQLKSDQFDDVKKAIEEGRTKTIGLGKGLNFLGGFNEETTFFGGDFTKKQADAYAKILKERYGFGDAGEVGDGVLRLEDQKRDFNKFHKEIVAEVKASIAEVELAFTNVERNITKKLGGAVVQMDKYFDASAKSSMNASERIIDAFSKAYGVSTDEAKKWLDSSGISAERLAEIFTSTSGTVLEKMIGVTEGAKSSFETITSSGVTSATNIKNSFTSKIGELSGILNRVNLGTARGFIKTQALRSDLKLPHLGNFATGGEFITPGAGQTDNQYRIGLTPGEKVTVNKKDDSDNKYSKLEEKLDQVIHSIVRGTEATKQGAHIVSDAVMTSNERGISLARA